MNLVLGILEQGKYLECLGWIEIIFMLVFIGRIQVNHEQLIIVFILNNKE